MTDETRLIPQRYYRDAVWAVDPGASNLSGLAHSLSEVIDYIENELQENDPVVQLTIIDLLAAVDEAWGSSDCSGTSFVNTYPDVQKYVSALSDFAFEVDDMRRVAAHPIIRLMVDQMRQLAGVPTPDNPMYFTLWSEAYETCKEKGN